MVWVTETRFHYHREIGGYPLRDAPSKRQFQYLLNGRQLTTALLTSFYGGSVEGQADRDPRIYVDLTAPEAGKPEEETWRVRFLFWDEFDDRGGELLRNVGRRRNYDKGLIVKMEDIAHRYQELEARLENAGYTFHDPARVHLHRLRQVLDNYKLLFTELHGIEVAEVCEILEQTNQGGQPLSMSDIVVAKTFRPEVDNVPGF